MPANQTGFKNSEKLTTWVRYFLYIQIAFSIISMISGYMEYQLFSDFQNNVYTSELASQEKMYADAHASDFRQRIIAISFLFVFVVSGVLILKWIYRANYNVRQLGAIQMSFTPGWSIGWHFVPFAAVWKPYQAMKEIWKASHFLNDRDAHSRTPLLPWWWFLWLLNGAIGQIVFRMSLKAEKIDELMRLNLVYQLSEIISIPLSLITLILINDIYKAQTKMHEMQINNLPTAEFGI